VGRHWDANKNTAHGRQWMVFTGVIALMMIMALLFPYAPLVLLLGGYGLACFLPALAVLQLRKWNRTLAFPAALLFSAIALMAFCGNASMNGFMITLFLCMTLIICATSDRLSFIYKWRLPFDHLGLLAVAFTLFLVISEVFLFFTTVLLVIIMLPLVLMVIRSLLFGYRGGRGWF
jgi:hypothetical protein